MSMPKGISQEDLIAAQELKAERDFKYITNQAIQNMNSGLAALSLLHQKCLGNMNDDHKYLLIEFENLREEILSSLKDMNQRLGDAETKLFEVLDQFNDFKEEKESAYVTRDSFITLFDSLERRVCNDGFNHSIQTDKSNISIENLKSKIKQDLELLRLELTPKTPEVDPVDTKLDERFKVFKVDFEGLVREIALLKKSSMYDQKKFENIYTLIERLKEGNK